jgi:uncharacterized membrane protein
VIVDSFLIILSFFPKSIAFSRFLKAKKETKNLKSNKTS